MSTNNFNPVELSVIPLGSYCYTFTGERKLTAAGIPSFPIERCPYWGIDNDQEHQSNGFCTLTGIQDWKDDSLLWDGVKECGVNLDSGQDK